MNSWKTTLSGIVSLIAGIGGVVIAVLGGATVDEIDWSALAATVAGGVAAIGTGIGLILARDNDKSSESAGAK